MFVILGGTTLPLSLCQPVYKWYLRGHARWNYKQMTGMTAVESVFASFLKKKYFPCISQ